MKKYISYAVNIAIALAVGGLSALATAGNFDVFDSVMKPPLTPPPVTFPTVWSVLFILMGTGAAIVYNNRKEIPFIYYLQLAVNFLWSIIFFNMQAYLFAFIWLLLLLILIILMFREFFHINKTAAYLQIPYILWVCFAGYLTLSIWILNH